MFSRADFQRWRDTTKIGAFTAFVSNAAQTFRRAAIDADFGVTLNNAQRVSSPILDVVPKTGTRVAVICRDGLPEYPIVLGEIYDDATEDGTVWIRADLDGLAGHVQIGGTKSVDVRVGSNPGLAGHTGLGDGKIRIGSDTVDIVEKLEQAMQLIKDLSVATANIVTSPGGETPDVASKAAINLVGTNATSAKALITPIVD